jgi:prevent-host-death family protein
MDTYNLYEAKTQLSKLVDRAAAGEEVIIAKAGKPLARLVPEKPKQEKRKFGQFKGEIWMTSDFGDPLPPDIQRYFEGEDDCEY